MTGARVALWNPTRLDLAIRRRGQSSYALAAFLGISYRAARRMIRGDSEAPAKAIIHSLGVWLDFPDDFFTGPTLEEPPNLGHYS